jgi:hypothetical protein
MMRPNPSAKTDQNLNKFAGLLPPSTTAGIIGSNPVNNLDKMSAAPRRPDNSFMFNEFGFIENRNSDQSDPSKVWSHKTDGGFGGTGLSNNIGKVSNFDPSGLIGSLLPNNDVDNAFIHLGSTAHSLLGGGNGNNLPPSSFHAAPGVNGPFGGMGGNNGDVNQPLPSFPHLWGGGGFNGGLKNVSGTQGFGSFGPNTEPIHTSLGDMDATNWNGIPRS